MCGMCDTKEDAGGRWRRRRMRSGGCVCFTGSGALKEAFYR